MAKWPVFGASSAIAYISRGPRRRVARCLSAFDHEPFFQQGSSHTLTEITLEFDRAVEAVPPVPHAGFRF
jgi:hypothetical protein